MIFAPSDISVSPECPNLNHVRQDRTTIKLDKRLVRFARKDITVRWVRLTTQITPVRKVIIVCETLRTLTNSHARLVLTTTILHKKHLHLVCLVHLAITATVLETLNQMANVMRDGIAAEVLNSGNQHKTEEDVQ